MAHSDAFYHSVATIKGGAALSGDATGRAVMPMGKAWTRCNPGVDLIWVDDMEGRPKAITPKQYSVLTLAMSLIEGEMLTMRQMAARLGVAPSTVSRAMTKLMAWGILAYVVGRGRWAGLVIFRRTTGDGLDRFRKAAQARVRRWKEAAERRVSRLWINVAPYIHEEVSKGSGSVYRDHYLVTYVGATLKQPWTPEDLRDAGII